MLTFDHFLIRPIDIHDTVTYFNLIEENRNRLTAYFPITTTTCIDHSSTQQYIESRIERMTRREFFTLVVVDELNQKMVGAISIKDIDWINLKSELGYFIDQHYANRGIASKTIQLVTSYCFKCLGLNKVFLRIAEENISSRRVAEKNHFTLEAILQKDLQINSDEYKDVAYYGLLNLNK